VVLEAVAQNGLALCFAAEKLRQDREIVEAAMAQNGAALQFASDLLRKDWGLRKDARAITACEFLDTKSTTSRSQRSTCRSELMKKGQAPSAATYSDGRWPSSIEWSPLSHLNISYNSGLGKKKMKHDKRRQEKRLAIAGQLLMFDDVDVEWKAT